LRMRHSPAALATRIPAYDEYDNPAYLCVGCDDQRPFQHAFCASCNEDTEGYKPDVTPDDRDRRRVIGWDFTR